MKYNWASFSSAIYLFRSQQEKVESDRAAYGNVETAQDNLGQTNNLPHIDEESVYEQSLCENMSYLTTDDRDEEEANDKASTSLMS